MLALAGVPFEIVVTHTDESRRPAESPESYARRLSREKAVAAARQLEEEALILAADTIVVDGDDVLGKPADPAEAAAMLAQLRGRTHAVFTAITLLDTATGQTRTDLARSPVRMRPYSDTEIAAYIISGDPFDKAGAYAIQHDGFRPVESFDHCFANVMGLPLCHVARALRAIGVEPPADVPAACQSSIAYVCPVYERILAGDD